jgi:hypothetical protein
MKRKHFLLISALVAWAFSLALILSPGLFVSGVPAQNVLMSQTTGAYLFGIGIINLFASRSPWSSAVRAIMLGNITVHLLGIGANVFAYLNGYDNLMLLLQAMIIHIIFLIGFCYYTFKKSTHDMSTQKEKIASNLPDAL